MDTLTRKTREAHLDMDHGFVRSIIQNQLDRDRYDKDVREKLTQRSQAVPAAARRTRTVPRRPDRAIYTPPVGRAAVPVAPSRAVLFNLEYFDSSSGAVRQQPFVEGTDLAVFCATFAGRAGLDGRLQQALYDRLKRELPAEQ